MRRTRAATTSTSTPDLRERAIIRVSVGNHTSEAFKSGLADNGRTRKVIQARTAPPCATFSRVTRMCLCVSSAFLHALLYTPIGTAQCRSSGTFPPVCSSSSLFTPRARHMCHTMAEEKQRSRGERVAVGRDENSIFPVRLFIHPFIA